MPRGIPNSKLDTTNMDVGQKTHVDMPAEGLIDRSAMRGGRRGWCQRSPSWMATPPICSIHGRAGRGGGA